MLKNEGGAFKLARVAPLPGQPGGLVLARNGRTLIVSAGDSIQFLDVALLKSGASEPRRAPLRMAGAGAVYVATSLDDRLLFVSEEARAQVGVIKLADLPLYIGAIPTGQLPVGPGAFEGTAPGSTPPVRSRRIPLATPSAAGRSSATGRTERRES